MSIDKKEFISVKTAAMEVEYTPRVIRNKCRAGEIQAKRDGRRYRIDRVIWEQWKIKKLGIAS